jgi:hypothetical protein
MFFTLVASIEASEERSVVLDHINIQGKQNLQEQSPEVWMNFPRLGALL